MIAEGSAADTRQRLLVRVNEAFSEEDLTAATDIFERAFSVQKEAVVEFTAVPVAHAHVFLDPIAVKAILYSLEANVIYGTLQAGISRLFQRLRQPNSVSKLEISSGETHGRLETTDPQALGEMIRTIPALLQKPPGYYELDEISRRWRQRQPRLGDETSTTHSKRSKGKKGKKAKKGKK